MSNLEDIQDLLDRADKFRANLCPPKKEINKEEYFIDNEIKFNYINDYEVEIITTGNIQEKFFITKNEATNGCTKTLTYTKLNKFHKEIETSIQFDVPAGVKNGQDIILKGKGNYLKENFSDLIIKIIIR